MAMGQDCGCGSAQVSQLINGAAAVPGMVQ